MQASHQKTESPRHAMMRPLNSELVLRAYRNMMMRTTKNVGRHKCWVFQGCLSRQDSTRGPKPRQSVQYRHANHTRLFKKSLDSHILAMIIKRKANLEGPWPDGYTVSHLCHERRCVNPDHLELETMHINNERNKCVFRGSCEDRHIGFPPCLLPHADSVIVID
jgi:hypothetical protein